MSIDTISAPSATSTSGIVVPYAGSTAPTDWLLCDGSAVSRTTYAGLFNVIGETYGVGDGSTTFNLPDLRGRIVAGKDDMGGADANRITSGGSGITGTTLGAAGGTQTHTLTTTEMASHNHAISGGSHAHTVLVGNSAYSNAVLNGGDSSSATGGNTNAVGTSISIQNNGSGSAHQNTQPSIILNYIIKT